MSENVKKMKNNEKNKKTSVNMKDFYKKIFILKTFNNVDFFEAHIRKLYLSTIFNNGLYHIVIIIN
mgnify:CR=1 FL=1